MESSRPSPWPRGASRTHFKVLGLGLGLGLKSLALALASETLSSSSPWPRLACPRMSLHYIPFRTITITLRLIRQCCTTVTKVDKVSHVLFVQAYATTWTLSKVDVKASATATTWKTWSKVTVNGINCCHCLNICFLCLPLQHQWNVSSVKVDYLYAHIVLNLVTKCSQIWCIWNATSTSECNMHKD